MRGIFRAGPILDCYGVLSHHICHRTDRKEQTDAQAYRDAAFWVLQSAWPAARRWPRRSPATLAKALEGAELDTADAWAYRKTMRVDAMDEPAVTSVVRWDPSKPVGEQCTVLSIEVMGPAKGKAGRRGRL